MILIDSVFVNVGGARVLLEYVISKLLMSSDDYFFLLDHRSENNLNVDLSNSKYKYVQGYFERKKFYKEHGNQFSKILCFGNLPPNHKIENTVVYTYFQQQLFLKIPKDSSFFNKIKYHTKIMILRSLVKNSDYWLVQSLLISNKLSSKFDIDEDSIKILPFYPPIVDKNEYLRVKNTFIYVSDATPHKNHYRLIEAFCKFYDKYNVGALTLTIPENATELLHFIKHKTEARYPINNIGFIKRDELCEQYSIHEYLVFPSLAESFGLGLVEAIECGCKIIAADLPYTYQVCKPSIIFNPLNVDSILEAFSKTLKLDDIPFAEKKINDNIDMLIEIFQN